jgi:hypothetical protein
VRPLDQRLRLEIRTEHDMLSNRRSAIVLAAVLLIGCGSGERTDVRQDAMTSEAATECTGRVAEYAKQFGSVSGVAAAYMSDAETVARWEETPREPGGGHFTRSRWRNESPGTPVVVCFLDGTFYPPGGPPERADRQQITRMEFLSGAGRIQARRVGTREDLPAASPSP